jgi:enoyl-CoA hydratase/carnithine racemase
MTNQVNIELHDGVLIVGMQRPEKKNALTNEMYAAMADAIEQAQSDRSVKVVLFTGSGDSFTAGNDLADFLSNPMGDAEWPVHRFIRNMCTTDVPLMAAVNGMAVGIGTTMLLHFDQVLASDKAQFSLPFINLGLVPEAGSSALLVNVCGYQKAAKLLMLGEPFSAFEALEYGIVTRLCGEADLMDEALAVARKIASKPSDALRATKRLMRRPPESLSQRIQAEVDLFDQCLAAPPAQEAMTAFMEKRPPDFKQFD